MREIKAYVLGHRKKQETPEYIKGRALRWPELHSHKILTKQQGWPREVSSVGNPWQALTGFNPGSLAL